MALMYLDAMEFLEEEREAWRPYEALLELTDAQLERPVDAVRGWSGRDLMVHLLAWLDFTLAAAKELAVREDSPTLEAPGARDGRPWRGRDERGVPVSGGVALDGGVARSACEPCPASCAAT